MNSKTAFFVVLLVFFVIVFVTVRSTTKGFRLGEISATKKMRQEAIEYGFGSYVVNPTNAIVTFKWLDK